ncbi:hypothetical protein ISS30_04755 [bacterium]|nr:hypothetical protein [bacterium]
MWCHASPHDTNILFILCMVSTAESRHHNELNPIFKVNSEMRFIYAISALIRCYIVKKSL